MQTRAARTIASEQDTLARAIGRIRAASDTAHEPISAKRAAVLVPLFEDSKGTIRVVLTRRTTSLSSHAGEVALPGGKRDETDRDDVHTALREAQEELGIVDVEVLGKLRPVLSKHMLSVTPVLGKIPTVHTLRPNPAEVDAVFDVPLGMFLEGQPGVYSYVDTTLFMGQRLRYRIHTFQHGEFTIWGLTAHILIEAATLALGRSPVFQVMPEGGYFNTGPEEDTEAQAEFRDDSKF